MRIDARVLAAVMTVALCCHAARAHAQAVGPAVSPATAAAGDPAPDISGIWFARFVGRLAPNPPLLPAARTMLDKRTPEEDPMAKCLPPGVPRVMSTAFPIEIVQTPGRVTILLEYDHYVRRIFTDGRPHPPDLDPTWLGHSIGHWEGKTLVVDTVGLNDKTWLDEAGHPHSEALHVVERFTRSDDGKSLEHHVTIDDPQMYAQPWTSSKTYAFRTDMAIMEWVCEG